MVPRVAKYNEKRKIGSVNISCPVHRISNNEVCSFLFIKKTHFSVHAAHRIKSVVFLQKLRSTMKILNARQIDHKITRLAIEILENNLEEESLILAGINTKGMGFAQLLAERLRGMSQKTIALTQVNIHPADPLSESIQIGLSISDLKDRTIILVDDVANTGRTLFYACKPMMETLPKRIEVAVLVDRQHKLFPIRVDYVGLSLATTLKENIEVQIPGDAEEAAVYLD